MSHPVKKSTGDAFSCSPASPSNNNCRQTCVWQMWHPNQWQGLNHHHMGLTHTTRQTNTAECDDRREREVAGTADMIKDSRTGTNRACQVLLIRATAMWRERHLRLSGGLFTIQTHSSSSWYKCYDDSLLRKLWAACWCWLDCNQAGFTVGSIVVFWGLMTNKQSHDGLLLPLQPAKIPFYTHWADWQSRWSQTGSSCTQALLLSFFLGSFK